MIQAVTPVWWLRGKDGRIRAVLDLRDPALKRVFVLMLPITLGVGLINFNLVINTFFASRYVDPTLAPSAIDAAFRIYMLPQGIFSVAVATVLFPALAARRPQRRGRLPGDGLAGPAPDRLLLLPASAVGAVLAVPIVRPLPARGLRRRSDPGRGRRLRGLRARAHLQRDDADAQPRVLQPPVRVGADGDRAREPRAQRGAERRPLPRLGNPARDLDRQHRRHCRAARPSGDASGGSTAVPLVLPPHQRRRRRRRRGGLRDLVRAGRALRSLARRADPLGRHRGRRRRRRLPRPCRPHPRPRAADAAPRRRSATTSEE